MSSSLATRSCWRRCPSTTRRFSNSLKARQEDSSDKLEKQAPKVTHYEGIDLSAPPENKTTFKRHSVYIKPVTPQTPVRASEFTPGSVSRELAEALIEGKGARHGQTRGGKAPGQKARGEQEQEKKPTGIVRIRKVEGESRIQLSRRARSATQGAPRQGAAETEDTTTPGNEQTGTQRKQANFVRLKVVNAQIRPQSHKPLREQQGERLQTAAAALARVVQHERKGDTLRRGVPESELKGLVETPDDLQLQKGEIKEMPEEDDDDRQADDFEEFQEYFADGAGLDPDVVDACVDGPAEVFTELTEGDLQRIAAEQAAYAKALEEREKKVKKVTALAVARIQYEEMVRKEPMQESWYFEPYEPIEDLEGWDASEKPAPTEDNVQIKVDALEESEVKVEVRAPLEDAKVEVEVKASEDVNLEVEIADKGKVGTAEDAKVKVKTAGNAVVDTTENAELEKSKRELFSTFDMTDTHPGMEGVAEDTPGGKMEGESEWQAIGSGEFPEEEADVEADVETVAKSPPQLDIYERIYRRISGDPSQLVTDIIDLQTALVLACGPHPTAPYLVHPKLNQFTVLGGGKRSLFNTTIYGKPQLNKVHGFYGKHFKPSDWKKSSQQIKGQLDTAGYAAITIDKNPTISARKKRMALEIIEGLVQKTHPSTHVQKGSSKPEESKAIAQKEKKQKITPSQKY